MSGKTMKTVVASWLVLLGLVLAVVTQVPLHANLVQAPTLAPAGGIAFQNVGDLGTQSATSTFTANYTTVSNSNTALIATAFISGNGSISTFTYNSVACDVIIDANFTGSLFIASYFCPVGSTTPGSYPLQYVVGASSTLAACVAEYSGVLQAAGFEAWQTNAGTSSQPSVGGIVTTASGDWILAEYAGGGGATTTSGAYNTTVLRTGCTSAANGIGDSGAPLPAGTYAGGFNATGVSATWGVIAFGLQHS